LTSVEAKIVPGFSALAATTSVAPPVSLFAFMANTM